MVLIKYGLQLNLLVCTAAKRKVIYLTLKSSFYDGLKSNSDLLCLIIESRFTN